VDDLGRKDGFFDMVLRLLQIRKENDRLTLVDDPSKAGLRKTERIAVSHVAFLGEVCVDHMQNSFQTFATSS
jgi:hypothetical protein